MLLVGVAIAVAGILLQQLMWSDLESMWIAQFAEQSETELSDETIAQLEQLVTLLMVLTMPSLYLLTTLCMMAARWAEVRLVSDAGFDREFQTLQFGRSMATGVMLLIAVFFWLQQQWMLGIALLLIMAFMYQGIAVAHHRLAKKNMPTVIFVIFYLLLIMFSQFTVIVMAITGIVDNWFDMRSLRTSKSDLDK